MSEKICADPSCQHPESLHDREGCNYGNELGEFPKRHVSSRPFCRCTGFKTAEKFKLRHY
jgi:hypothetical protein